MSAQAKPLLSRIISASPFVPHTLEHLTEKHVFPNPLPEQAYVKMLEEYAALEDVAVSRIVYDSDGLKVTGLMALPVHIRKGAHPVLIYNRGGSREYGKLTLLSALRSMVPFAREGMLVFATNYRGNDGGEGREEFGGADLNDVMNLLNIARSHEGFDGCNTFMIGHSRGGMMTAMAIRRGARLNAAVSIAGISDAFQFEKTLRSEKNVLTVLVPGYPAERERVLTERSAVRWPQDITVPLLLLHGDADKDVDYRESVSLDKLIREAGGTSELVIYPGGSHSLIRVWDDVLIRCSVWMGTYRI